MKRAKVNSDDAIQKQLAEAQKEAQNAMGEFLSWKNPYYENVWLEAVEKVRRLERAHEGRNYVFDARLPQPRGFLGRPLIALLFAVGTGILAYHVGSWFHLNGPTISVIIVAAVGIAGYLWHRAEKPK